MIPVKLLCNFVAFCLMTGIGVCGVAFAQDNPPVQTPQETVGTNKPSQTIEYSHEFYREKKITLSDGKTEIKREYVTQTIPGEELLAIVPYTYKKSTPAEEIILTLPIPKETIFVENSATDADNVWYSADNAKEWSKFSDLRVIDKDGSKRIALGADVTHLQWRITKPFKYGDTGTLEYRVIIR